MYKWSWFSHYPTLISSFSWLQMRVMPFGEKMSFGIKPFVRFYVDFLKVPHNISLAKRFCDKEKFNSKWSQIYFWIWTNTTLSHLDLKSLTWSFLSSNFLFSSSLSFKSSMAALFNWATFSSSTLGEISEVWLIKGRHCITVHWLRSKQQWKLYESKSLFQEFFVSFFAQFFFAS